MNQSLFRGSAQRLSHGAGEMVLRVVTQGMTSHMETSRFWQRAQLMIFAFQLGSLPNRSIYRTIKCLSNLVRQAFFLTFAQIIRPCSVRHMVMSVGGEALQP